MPADISNIGTAQKTSGNGNANASNRAPATTNDNTRLEIGSKTKAKNSSERIVPDGGWGSVVVIGSFMAHVIADGISFSFGVFVEDLVDYFESSKSAVGGVGSLMIGMTFFAGNVNLHHYMSIPYDNDN